MALANTQINTVQNAVSAKLHKVLEWANTAQSTASQAIGSITVAPPLNITIKIPEAPGLEPPNDPGVGEVPSSSVSVSPSFGGFAPTEGVTQRESPSIPAAEYGAPVAPSTVPSPTYPRSVPVAPSVSLEAVPQPPAVLDAAKPPIQLEVAPQLVNVQMHAMPRLSLQALGVAPPQFEKSRLDSLLAQAEQLVVTAQQRAGVVFANYRTQNDDLEVEIRTTYLDGYRRRLEARRKRLMDAALVETDRESARLIEKTTGEWAARNFSLPPGMLVDEVNQIDTETGRKLRAAASQINKELARLALEDAKREYEIYVALEKCLVDLHAEYLRQITEIEKLKLQQHIEMYNAVVQALTIQSGSAQSKLEANAALVQAQVKQSEANKTAVEELGAVLATNDAQNKIYAAQVEVVKAQVDASESEIRQSMLPIEAYQAQLVGVKANAATIVANVEAYRDAVRGYAAAIEAASAEVEAYAAQVEAYGQAANVEQANAQLYATRVQEVARAYETYASFVRSQSEVINANLQAFRVAADAHETFYRAHAAKISSEAEIASARASAHNDVLRVVSNYNRADADYSAAVSTYNMVKSENAARLQALQNQITAETARINAGGAAAKTSALAGLAQGAMSALHVSASAQGVGSTSSNFSYSTNTTSNWGGTKTLSESKIERLSA